MSSTNFSKTEGTSEPASGSKLRLDKTKVHWCWANIVTMVLGFFIFPLIGLVILIWTLLGHPVQELPNWIQKKWRQLFTSAPVDNSETDNGVFNEFQQTQYETIQELEERINKRSYAFRVFREDVKRQKDQQEFDDFMASQPPSDKYFG